MAVPDKESAQFVFQGTVKKLKAANLAGIADTERTAVVAVDRVMRSARSLTTFAGRQITVQLAKGERVKVGQQAVFYTNGWMFAENLAVRSIGHESAPAKPAIAAAAMLPEHDPVRVAAHQKIRERAKDAQVVLSGKIIAVGLPAPSATVAAAASGGTAISEHDPLWREAVVEVQEVHKGALGKKQVVLRFPGSSDVRWYKAPKFHAGQQGVFSLRPDQISGHTAPGPMAASLSPGAAPAAFTCLQSADFQPSDSEAEAAAAIAAAKE
jgi:hypothetical protein